MVQDTGERERVDAIRDRVRAAGRRWTPAKGAVVDTLLDNTGHMSALQIHDLIGSRLPNVDQSTVYRVLLSLTDDGVVHTLDQPGEARYGLADAHHHHAICERCGRQAEIPAATVTRLLAAAGERTGFRFSHRSITLTGVCQDCA